MPSRASNYLRRQAELCLALSRATLDLGVAGRLRALAEDLRATAAEWEGEPEELPRQRLERTYLRTAM
jgi:hypothetical protein